MKYLWALAGLAAAAPSNAEVVSSAPGGFHVRHSVTVPAGRDAAFEGFAKIDCWWDKAHSYGGDASRLSLAVTPGGCFCESLPGGGIEHLRVSYVDRPKRLVMTGGLGPLLYQAVAGVMDLKFEDAGTGTKVTMDYKVAGFASGGADTIAAPVDRMLGDQLARYAAASAAGTK